MYKTYDTSHTTRLPTPTCSVDDVRLSTVLWSSTRGTDTNAM